MKTFSLPSEDDASPTITRRTIDIKTIWWKWTLATFIGWLASLCLASIPGVSRENPDFLGGPIFVFNGTWIVILFGFMGLISSLPQAWLLGKSVKRSFYWAAASMLGAVLGGIFAATFSSALQWMFYSFCTIIPVSLAQGIALGIFFSKFRVGLYWMLIKFSLTSFLSLFVGFFIEFISTSPIISAISYSVGMGLPLGILTGLFIAKTIKSSIVGKPILKNTVTKENILKSSTLDEPVSQNVVTKEKKRHGCLTAFLIYLIIGNLFEAIYYLIIPSSPALPGWYLSFLIVSFFLYLVAAIALFRWKKWSFWFFCVISVFGVVVNLLAGYGFVQSLLALLGLAVLIGVLNIGEENKGWPQLE